MLDDIKSQDGSKERYLDLAEELVIRLNGMLQAMPSHTDMDDEKIGEEQRVLSDLRNEYINDLSRISNDDRWEHINEQVNTGGFDVHRIPQIGSDLYADFVFNEEARHRRRGVTEAELPAPASPPRSVPSMIDQFLQDRQSQRFGGRRLTQAPIIDPNMPPLERGPVGGGRGAARGAARGRGRGRGQPVPQHNANVLYPNIPVPRQPRPPRQPVQFHVRQAHRNVVRASAAGTGFAGRLAGNQFHGYVGADRGGQVPPYGRVHLVQMANIAGTQHFMNELVQDANMGRIRVETSRRGPFRGTSGHIKTMARSTHIVYRVRGGVLQITVYRGVIKTEMDVLIGKLGAHRISTKKTICTLVVRGRKRKLGDLQTLDLAALRGAVLESLSKAKSVGISLHDIGDKGSLHRQHRPEREYR